MAKKTGVKVLLLPEWMLPRWRLFFCPRVHNSRRLLFRVRQEEGGIKWQNFFHYTTQMERSCVGCVNLSTVPHNLDRDSTAVMLTVTHTANANRGSHVVIVRIILRSPKRMES